MLSECEREIRFAEILGSDAVDHLRPGTAGYGFGEHMPLSLMFE
jgi:hypothetical protein